MILRLLCSIEGPGSCVARRTDPRASARARAPLVSRCWVRKKCTPQIYSSLRAPTGPVLVTRSRGLSTDRRDLVPVGHGTPGYLRAVRAPDVPHPWTRQLFQVRPKPDGERLLRRRACG